MIECKRTNSRNSKFARHKLFINGEETSDDHFRVSGHYVAKNNKGPMRFSVEVRNSLALELLFDHPLGEFADGIDLSSSCESTALPELKVIELDTRRKMAVIRLGVSTGFQDWDRPYSHRTFIKEFSKLSQLAAEADRPTVGSRSSWTTTFIDFHASNLETTLREYVDHYAIMVENLFRETDVTLRNSSEVGSVVLSFNFPEPIRSACEQYLVYFGQFLKDIGINSTSKLEEQAGEVLFTITPTDDIEALDNIREALEVYLALPMSPVNNTSTSNEGSRLESHVLFLQSEILRERAQSQNYLATIRLQESTIQSQQVKLSSEVMMSSLKNVTPKPSDKEDVVKGLIKVGTLEKYGFEFNFGEGLRRLKAKVLSRRRKSKKVINVDPPETEHQ